jgi:hypothetical protein
MRVNLARRPDFWTLYQKIQNGQRGSSQSVRRGNGGREQTAVKQENMEETHLKIVTDHDVILELSLIKICLGLLNYFNKTGKAILKNLLLGKLKIEGMLKRIEGDVGSEAHYSCSTNPDNPSKAITNKLF